MNVLDIDGIKGFVCCIRFIKNELRMQWGDIMLNILIFKIIIIVRIGYLVVVVWGM